LNNIIEFLDKKAEIQPLDQSKRESLQKVIGDLAVLRRDEESKWAQRAKVKHIQEGGNNTKYFHLVANDKHRRKCIF
jgi:hypothetical protein